MLSTLPYNLLKYYATTYIAPSCNQHSATNNYELQELQWYCRCNDVTALEMLLCLSSSNRHKVTTNIWQSQKTGCWYMAMVMEFVAVSGSLDAPPLLCFLFAVRPIGALMYVLCWSGFGTLGYTLSWSSFFIGIHMAAGCNFIRIPFIFPTLKRLFLQDLWRTDKKENWHAQIILQPHDPKSTA